MRLSHLAFAALVLAMGSAPAFAQSDFQHHQAMVDIAATPPWDYDDYGYEDDGPSFDLSHWRDWSDAPPVQLTDEERDNIARYRAFMDGAWFHGEAGSGAVGGACVATFLRQGSGVMVAALGGAKDWALLGIFSQDAPRPAELQTIQVTLTQSGDPPATVNAFSLALPWDREHLGLVVFAVPAADALVGGMMDSQGFDVAIKGKRVASIVWNDGLAARDELAACVARR